MNQHSTGKILVVEDELINRKLLIKNLQNEGFHAVGVGTGEEALELLKCHPFDAVLLDYILPGINGNEVLNMIKSNPEWHDISIIAISCENTKHYIAEQISNGAEDHIPKPCDPMLLKARLDSCLAKKRFHEKEKIYMKQLVAEKEKNEALLNSILPEVALKELKDSNKVEPKHYEHVAVLFSDIVGFTTYCENNHIDKVVENLQAVVEKFEKASTNFCVEKIKTIGDSFMCAAGLLYNVDNPVDHCIKCGLEMIDEIEKLNIGWKLRIGIHYGSVMGGIIGRQTYLFDIWGDTVNIASHCEKLSPHNGIAISEAAMIHVKSDYDWLPMGEFLIKRNKPLKLFTLK